MAYDYHVYRRRILPSQLDRARRKYHSLVREAERYGMMDILNLSDQKSSDKEKIPILDMSFVFRRTAEIFGTTEKDIRSDSRFFEHAYPRMLLYYALRNRGMSFGQIARQVGRDSSTVRYGCSRAEKIISEYPEMRIGYRQLKEVVR